MNSLFQVRDEGLGWKRRYVEHEERLGTEAPEKKEKHRAKMGIWEVSQQLRAKAAQQTGEFIDYKTSMITD